MSIQPTDGPPVSTCAGDADDFSRSPGRLTRARRVGIRVGAVGAMALAFTLPLVAQQTKAVQQPNSSVRSASTRPPALLGTWRVIRGMRAPWATDKKYNPDTLSWIGKTIRFDAARVTGPEVLNCANLRYEATSVPAEGMFQGGLTKTAKAEAEQVGVSKFPVPGVSLTCDTGIFEFHFPDGNSALLAMSNAIWTLDRSPGALAEATSPSGVVERFLEAHFARDMEFSRAAVQPKARFMTAGLNTLMTRYFAVPANPNEAPDINGDPFTNSQDYPARFSVGAATTTANASTVRVRFSDAFRVQALSFQLKRENNLWRIDDVKFADGVTLRRLLSDAIPGR